MHRPKWCLFFDFHTMPACPEVGKHFDADALAQHAKACGVDFMVFPAKCNMGMAYYNTKVGIRHYSLDHDLFGELAEACRKRDIALSAYFNTGLSHEETLLHRDWSIVFPTGHMYSGDTAGSFFRRVCYNTPYGDHVIAMIREIVSGYPVSGLFLDCFNTAPCIGVECMRDMKAKGVNWQDEKELHTYNREKILRMAHRISDAARAIDPELLIYFNGVHYEDQQECGTYLELECLPTGGWGYELLPLGSRYLRTLGKPVLNMTGRFHKAWGDFGGIRTEPSLEYDCIYGLANGMRPTIGDHFHPRGDMNKPVCDMEKRVYGRLRKLEPWIDGATPLTDAAVVHMHPYHGCKWQTKEEHEAYEQDLKAAKAATRMLCELKQQFDVVSRAASWEGYKLLVLPDFVRLDSDLAARIRKHIQAGGTVLSSGWSGLNPERSDFAMQEWGVEFKGDSPHDPAYFVAGPSLSTDMPDMPLNFYERGTAVVPLETTESLAGIVAPYYNQGWDGEHGFRYTPPDRATDETAVTQCGPVVHATHPLFTIYYHSAPVYVRQLVANVLERLLPQPMVRAPGLPSYARVTVTSQPGRRMVYVMTYLPEKRGDDTNIIEEPIELRDVEIALRTDGRRPSSVYLAPTREIVAFKMQGDYVKATLPLVRGYAVLVFEEDGQPD